MLSDAEEFRELSADCMELLISVGLMTSVSDQWPEHVQDTFLEKVQDLRRQVQQQSEEIQLFASSYDR